jgi:hypothetical protein
MTMCEFISWIEKDGQVFFLTAKDLKSKRGRELKKHCGNDADLVGHGAIRYYFDLIDGKDKECIYFGDPEKFPPEIQQAILNGEFVGMGICLGVLNNQARTEYCKMEQAARLEYDKIEMSARLKREKINNQAWSEHGMGGRRIYDRIKDQAWKEYIKTRDQAWAEYIKIRISFWELVKDTKNLAPQWKKLRR